MFPIRDDNPTHLTPIVTIALIAANAASWVLIQGLGSEAALLDSLCTLGMIPGEFLERLPAGTTVPLGEGASCILSGESSGYTALTSMFLHGGWLHLIFNMWFLWIFGNNIEDSMGHLRFAVFYLLTGFAATAAQVLSDPDSALPMVGASGAIGGVMGAYIVLYPRVRVQMLFWVGFYVTTFSVPASLMLGFWLLLQVVGGAAALGSSGGGVAFWAHVGGFVAGAVLIFPFRSQALLARHPNRS